MISFNLINTEDQKALCDHLISIQRDDEGKDFTHIYRRDDFIIIYYINKGNIATDDTEDQTEIPIESLKWIYESITNGFWCKPSDGGLPKNKHAVSAKIASEHIIVKRTMNAEYGKPGFTIVNKSRECHIVDSWPQEVSFTDEQLQQVLIPKYEQCSSC